MDEIETSPSNGCVEVQVCPPEKNQNEDEDETGKEMPFPLFDQEFEMTIDSQEPLVSISPTASKKDASAPKGAESVHVPVETHANKLNTTAETAESSILDSSAETDINTSTLSRIQIPSDIFTDAFDQLTDIAVAAGIVTADSSPAGNGGAAKTRKEEIAASNTNEEEPGRIISASFDDDEAQPFDEDERDNVLDVSLPFDEMLGGRKHPEDLSAIARMRYRQINESADTSKAEPLKSAGKSYEEIRKEKHEKWRNLRHRATREEAEIMQMHKRGEELLDALSENLGEKSKPPKSRKSEESITGTLSSDPTKEDSSFIDISVLTKPIEDAWNQSQAALFEAVMGHRRDDDNHSEHSRYEDSDYDDDSCSEASSYYSDNDEDSEFDSADRGRRSKRGHSSEKRRGHGNNGENEWDDESESDEEDEEFETPRASSEGGSNRNFMDDITGEGIHLTWHRPRSSPSSKELACKVIVNIQISGAEGGGGQVEPNLVWEIKEKGHSRRSRYCAARRESLSLFDISSIQKAADSIKLNVFPHANPFNSIMITLHDGSMFLFEAESASEAKKIMHGLRWIEARLTFNLIVGNVNVCSEMLSMSEQVGISELTSDIFLDVTNQLVEKTLYKLE